MIVSDMDGTLLNSKHRLTENTIRVLQDAQRQGMKLVLASGRNRDNLKQYAKMLEIEKYQGAIIGLNGQTIDDFEKNDRLAFETISQEKAQELLKIGRRYALEAICMSYEQVIDYTPSWLYYLKYFYFKLTKRSMHRGFEGDFRQHQITHQWRYPFSKDVNKVCYAQLGSWLSLVLPHLRKRLEQEYEVLQLNPRWVEIMPKHVNKGRALEVLMTRYDIQKDEVLVFGDGENDLSMLEKVTYGYSMQNALPQVYAKTTYHCLSNDEEGVASTVQHYLNILP